MFKRILAVLGFSLFALHSQAATLLVDGSGQLTGATGVDVGGTLYDVNFVDGTCINLFDRCGVDSNFVFQTESSARLASLALLDQVLIDSSEGSFDSQPALTQGITNPDYSWVHTPYLWDQMSFTQTIRALNTSDGSSEGDYTGALSPIFDTGASSRDIWAVWTPTPVPVPAAGWLFMSAMLGLVGLRRKSRR